MSRTQQERSTATQARLLDATISCLVDLGYAGTSTTAICKRAGLSRGAQLHHYPTKAQLVCAAIEHLFMRRHQEFRDSLGAQPNLDSAFSGLWEIYASDTLYAWMELLVASRTDELLRGHLRAVDDRFFAEAMLTCRRLLGMDDGDEERVAALARLILSVFDGLALNHTLGGREEIARNVLSELRAAIAASLGRE